MLHRLLIAGGLGTPIRSAAVLCAAISATPAAAACARGTAGDIAVEHAWSRASPAPGVPGVLYLTVRNTGAADDALVSLSTPAAAQSMLHETVVADGIAKMPHASAIPVPAGATVQLRPSGYHGMLVGLAEPLREGGSFPVTLTFARAGTVTVPVDVLSVRAKGSECDGAR